MCQLMEAGGWGGDSDIVNITVKSCICGSGTCFLCVHYCADHLGTVSRFASVVYAQWNLKQGLFY
jgi:hypothetical protein